MRKVWTAKDEAYLRKAMKEGMTQREIARRLGTSHATIRGRAVRLGLHTTKPSPISAHLDTPERIQAQTRRLRDAVICSIARYANDNGLDIDSAARRLLSGAVA